MKIKIIILTLSVACGVLLIALLATRKQSDEQHTADVNARQEFSNQLVAANSKVNELNQVNLALTNDLSASLQQVSQARQQAEQLSNSLATVAATLEGSRTSLASARDQIAGLNTQISDLEQKNQALDQHASELTNTIAQLNLDIASAQNQLAISETNRLFIEQQLQKQMAQKAELERKFNDLNEVRAQMKKLKDEQFVARRLQLMKNDNGSKKGAELLLQHNPPSAKSAAAPRPANYNLNVEVGSDGSVRVIPPLTNSAAH